MVKNITPAEMMKRRLAFDAETRKIAKRKRDAAVLRRSPSRERSRSPIATATTPVYRSPAKTRSRPPAKTRSRPPAKTRSRSPAKTRSRSPAKTRSRSPAKTRSRSLSPNFIDFEPTSISSANIGSSLKISYFNVAQLNQVIIDSGLPAEGLKLNKTDKFSFVQTYAADGHLACESLPGSVLDKIVKSVGVKKGRTKAETCAIINKQ